jgi:tellurite resistance protein TehA-like permease
MATAALSLALNSTSPDPLSLIFLGLAAAGYVELVVAEGMKVVGTRGAVRGPNGVSGRLGWFAFGVGSVLLSSRFSELGVLWIGVVLLLIGGVAALVCSYVVPVTLALKRKGPGMLRQGGGTWMLWPASLEAVASAASQLSRLTGFDPHALALITVGLWSIGLTLYLPLLILLAGEQLFSKEAARPPEPSYWICMGAAALSAAAGSQVVTDPVTRQLMPYLLGPMLAADTWLWVLATTLLPLMAGLVISRWRLRQQLHPAPDQLWLPVFPIAVYALASSLLGRTLHFEWMVDAGRIAVWFALAAWLVDLGRGVLMRLLPTE